MGKGWGWHKEQTPPKNRSNVPRKTLDHALSDSNGGGGVSSLSPYLIWGIWPLSILFSVMIIPTCHWVLTEENFKRMKICLLYSSHGMSNFYENVNEICAITNWGHWHLWRPLSDCLATAEWLLGNSWVTAWQQLSDCLATAEWLLGNSWVTAWRSLDDPATLIVCLLFNVTFENISRMCTTAADVTTEG